MFAEFDNRLDPSTAHLWVVDLASVDTPVVENLRLLLSEGELKRAQRFQFERDRRTFLVSYGLLRSALTWVVPGVRPKDWIFTRAPNGRPEIDQPSLLPWLRFNISHTTGLVACLVTAKNDCGVDVEAVVPVPDLESLSWRILAPSERAHIAALPDHMRHCGFFRLWTLKEAYAKARGLGVSLPFEQLPFECHEDGIRLDIDPTLNDGGQWYFEQWQPRSGYILSLAVRRGQGGFRGVVRHTGVPSLTPL
jgi:4'-phosphopantetheinyl transferase